MRHYVCECQVCHARQQYAFTEPYPELGAVFNRQCNIAEVIDYIAAHDEWRAKH